MNSTTFESLDLENFERFGQEIHSSDKEKDVIMAEEDEDTTTGEDKKEGSADNEKDAELKHREKDGDIEESGVQNELTNFKGVDTTSSEVVLATQKRIERAASLGSVKPLAPPALKKWENMSSLEHIGESGEEVRQSVVEEEDEQRDRDEINKHKSTSIQEHGSSAIHEKETDRTEGGDKDAADMEVLKRVSLIEEEGMTSQASPVKKDSVVKSGQVGLGIVKSGSVSAKLKMFGGSRRVTHTMSDGEVTMPQLRNKKCKYIPFPRFTILYEYTYVYTYMNGRFNVTCSKSHPKTIS